MNKHLKMCNFHVTNSMDGDENDEILTSMRIQQSIRVSNRETDNDKQHNLVEHDVVIKMSTAHHRQPEIKRCVIIVVLLWLFFDWNYDLAGKL